MPTIRGASMEDVPSILALADANKDELGSLGQHPKWLTERIYRGEVFVADDGNMIIGFVCFQHELHSEDAQTNVYYLCTDIAYRGLGVGKLLMEALAVDARLYGNKLITLKCPEHLLANHFYRSIGYEREGSEADCRGVHLNVWRLKL
jgi:ribosomal protein S18 acetylase RimI-like enzyme